MMYDSIIKELLDIKSYLNKNNNINVKELYKLYIRYLKLSVLISNSIPTYNNDSNNYHFGNCYIYALVIPTLESINNMFISYIDYNIGFISEKDITFNTRVLLDNFKRDLDILGIEYYSTCINDSNKHNGYKVAMYKSKEDFHFIRENSDKVWSHKIGYSDNIEVVKPEYKLGDYNLVDCFEIVKPTLRRL